MNKIGDSALFLRNRALAPFLLILSVGLLYLSFPNVFNSFGWWPFAWVFAIPLFFLSREKGNVKASNLWIVVWTGFLWIPCQLA